MQPRGGPRAPKTGLVTEFDEARGLGTLCDDDGLRYPFHCTAIADGSRRIAVGTRVLFVVGPGHSGRYEGRAVTPVRAG